VCSSNHNAPTERDSKVDGKSGVTFHQQPIGSYCCAVEQLVIIDESASSD
jgi:hypothetical protein